MTGGLTSTTGRQRRPSFQFYPGDWLGNAKLRRCSPAARGAWMDVLCLMHDAEPEYGVLRWPLKDIARAAGVTLGLLRELEHKGVLKGSDHCCAPYVYTPRHAGQDGEPVTLVQAGNGPCWYCSRMVRDEYVRQRRGGDTRFQRGAGEPPERPPKGQPKGGFGDGIGGEFGDGSSSSSPSSSSTVGGEPPTTPSAEASARTPESKPKRARSASSEAAATWGVAELIAEGVNEQHARDWLAIRRKAGAICSPSAWDLLTREAAAAGVSMAEAVQIAAEHGWRGFKAGYVQSRTAAPRQQQSRTDARAAVVAGLTGQPIHGRKVDDVIDIIDARFA